MKKLLSGRYFLTVISGLVFAYAVWKRILPSEATASIIAMVFVSYFSRKRVEDDQHKKENGNELSKPNQS